MRKGNGRKGEHESKGGFGSKGTQQGTRTMKDEDEEEEQEERGRAAPDMGAGGQAISDPAENEGTGEVAEGENEGKEETAEGEQQRNEQKEEILRLLRGCQEKEEPRRQMGMGGRHRRRA